MEEKEVKKFVFIFIILIIVFALSTVILFGAIIKDAFVSVIKVEQSTDYVIPYESVVFDGNTLNLKVKRNSPVGDLTGLKFVLENDEGNSYIYEVQTTLGFGEEKFFSIPTSGKMNKVTKVSIFPIFRNSETNRTELGNPVTHNLDRNQQEGRSSTESSRTTNIIPNTSGGVQGSGTGVSSTISNTPTTSQGTTGSQIISDTINISLIPSRTTCVAPCGVFFDASGTQSTKTDREFEELYYVWNFGDPSSNFINMQNINANSAKGAIVAHVFNNPGTYNINLSVKDFDGEIDTKNISILVQDPNIVFAGKTYCVSSSVDTSCASNSQSLLDFNQSIDKLKNSNGAIRILFKRGEVFNANNVNAIIQNKQGPIYIGAYGSESLPMPRINKTGGDNTILFRSSKNVIITGINFTGEYNEVTGLGTAPPWIIQSESGSEHILVYRNSFTGFDSGVEIGRAGLGRFEMVIDNSFSNWNSYSVGSFGALGGGARESAIIGNKMRRGYNVLQAPGRCSLSNTIPCSPDQGAIRIGGSDKLIISANNIFSSFADWIGTGNTTPQPNIRLGTGGEANRSIISDNFIEGGFVMVALHQEDPNNIGLYGRSIWERNTFITFNQTYSIFHITLGGFTIRNNLFIDSKNGPPLAGLSKERSVININNWPTSPENKEFVNYIYGNTFISFENQTDGITKFISVPDNSLKRFIIKNNLFYAPLIQMDNDPRYHPAFILWQSTTSDPKINLDSDYNVFFTSSPNKFAEVLGSQYNFSQWKGQFLKDRNSKIQNPLIINYNENNLNARLSYLSPAVDSGIILRGLYEDFDGNIRPKGNGIDIGTFESTFSVALSLFCGDNQCNGDETCSSCSRDCGACPSVESCGNGICGFGEDVLSCPQDCPSICGDNVKSGTEQCDGNAFGGATCQSLGFTSGTLSCSSSCTISTSNCISGGGGSGTGNLILHYKFDDSPSDGVLDSSGQGNNGICNQGNCPIFLSSGGKYGGAYQFEGKRTTNAKFVLVGNKLNLSDKTFTLSAWVYPIGFQENPNDNNISSVLGSEEDTITNKALIRIGDGTIDNRRPQFSVSDRTGAAKKVTARNTTLLTKNQWHHLAGVYNGSHIILYVNGVKEGNLTFSSSPVAEGDFLIGSRKNGTRVFNGTIDDVRIYTRALSDQEIQNLYNSAVSLSPLTYKEKENFFLNLVDKFKKMFR
ncbi:MAG: LamG-like jellyroll fold domain-containing protein [Candidatus Pacearchaeota archaeon]